MQLSRLRLLPAVGSFLASAEDSGHNQYQTGPYVGPLWAVCGPGLSRKEPRMASVERKVRLPDGVDKDVQAYRSQNPQCTSYSHAILSLVVSGLRSNPIRPPGQGEKKP
jgi:hypothetical protein